PKIVDGIGEEGTELEIPQVCPSCSHPTGIDGPRLVCLNTECPGQNMDKLLHASRMLEIENLGPKTIEKLFNLGIIKREYDLLTLSAEDLSKIRDSEED